MRLEQFIHPLISHYLAHGIRGLSRRERHIIAVWLGDSELHAGGLEQFYLNATGELAAEFADALNRISATDKAAVVEKANKLFGGKPPIDHQLRKQALENQVDRQQLKDLTNRYLTSGENVKQLLSKFIQ